MGWPRTAPTAMSEASAVSDREAAGSGCTNIEALERADFAEWKAAVLSSVQLRAAFWDGAAATRAWSGARTEATEGRKRW